MGKGFGGAIFDVDGVLVDSPHERAWRDAFQEMMDGDWSDVRDQTTYSPEKFTPQVYQQVMSGKPRMEGARAVVDYFEVPDREGRVEAYPDALRFVLAVKNAGIPTAAASSSKNAGLFLRQIRLDTFAAEEGLSYDFVTEGLSLLDFFDVDISGRDFPRGKPDPEIFLTGAKELEAPPGSCFVVEDAVSGVQAAKAGDLAALGLARADDADILAAAGADLVVTTLDDVDIDGLSEGRLARKDLARKDG